MRIVRKSQLTGRVHEMDLPVTPMQLSLWQAGELIQRAMPLLTDSEREFIMTGITPEEWDAAFPEEDDQ